MDFLQERKTLILVYSIINGLYSILNFGLNLVDFATPGLLRNSLITQTQKTNFTTYLLLLVVAALLWMGLHGYSGPDLGFWRSRQKLGKTRQTYLALQAKLGKRIWRPRQR